MFRLPRHSLAELGKTFRACQGSGCNVQSLRREVFGIFTQDLPSISPMLSEMRPPRLMSLPAMSTAIFR